MLLVHYTQTGALTWNTVRFFRWHYIKTLDDFYPKSTFGMYKNYFKISLRNMSRNKLYTGINVAGLTVGIASCLLILVHVFNELN
jgi:putative ABC transport system permease protein